MINRFQSPSFLSLLSLGVLASTGSAAAAPVVTTDLSGPNAPSTTTDEVTFAADVSNTDLLHGIVGTGGSWNANGSSPDGLNDADPGGDFDDEGLAALGGAAWARDGDGVSFREFELGTGTGNGYDLTEIQSIAAWQGAGFSNQKYEVRVRLVGEASFPVAALLTVDYQPFPATPLNNGGSTKVNVTDDTGLLAGEVEAIRFDILDTVSNNGGGAVFREIDVFGTPSAADVTPPEIATLDPADNATNVPTNANLVATFNDVVAAGTGNITIRNLTDGPPDVTIAIDDTTQVAFSGATVTIDPVADLLAGKDYAVQIDATAIDDNAGNSFAGIIDTTSWNFATDGTAPMSSGMSPVAGATDVLSTSDLTLLFDEDVKIGTGSITIHLAADNSVVETIDVTSGNVTINGAEVTIDPTGDLAGGTAYYVIVTAGAFSDLSGNAYAGISDSNSWTFTTSSVIITEVFSTTQFAFAADVSDSDLLHGMTPVTAGWNLGNEASPLELTDGIHGVGFDEVPGDRVQGAWTTVGATAEYALGTGANGLGYDLTSMQSIADWLNVGFGNQAWTVEVQPVGGSYRALATIDYQPLGDGGGTTKVTLTDPSGVLASGIEAIRITANRQDGHASGAFVWRELDVFGTDTGGAAIQLGIARNGGTLDFAWNSRSGMQYDLVTSIDLTTPINTWVFYDDGTMTYEDIPATGMSTTQTGVLKDGSVRFFAVIEEEIPPLFLEDFESGDGGFTVATSAGTDWEHGAPDSSGLGGTVNAGNGGSVNAWGTNLGDASGTTGNIGLYADSTITCLRSAVIDLTGVAGAELMFAEALDLEQDTTAPDDLAVVNIIDDTTDTVIAAAIYTATDSATTTAGWASAGPITIPAAALGQPVRIEWCLNGFGGDSNDYLGWYIDDVVVTETFP